MAEVLLHTAGVETPPSGLAIGGTFANMAIDPYKSQLVDLYQKSFAAKPWSEVSKCPATPEDRIQPCTNGYTALAIGQICTGCELQVTETAFTENELLDKFNTPVIDGYRLWYMEKMGSKIVLAAMSRVSSVESLTNFLDTTSPELSKWVTKNQPDSSKKLVWIEDVFANTNIRPKGNLWNFGEMCKRLASGLSDSGKKEAEIMLKTLNPRLVRAAQRDFGRAATINDSAFGEIPGEGKVITIFLKNEKTVSN